MKASGRAFFLIEQRKPLHRSTANLLLNKYGEKARLPVAVHPHMLRHACGFALANQGADTRLIQDYLGHRKLSTLCATPPLIRHGLRSCGDNMTFDGTQHQTTPAICFWENQSVYAIEKYSIETRWGSGGSWNAPSRAPSTTRSSTHSSRTSLRPCLLPRTYMRLLWGCTSSLRQSALGPRK